MIKFHKTGVEVGLANTQHEVIIQTEDMLELNLMFYNVGNFSNHTITIWVSVVGGAHTNYTKVDDLASGVGSSFSKFYDANHFTTTLPVNVLSFPYIKIQVPQLGAAEFSTITYCGRTANFHG